MLEINILYKALIKLRLNHLDYINYFYDLLLLWGLKVVGLSMEGPNALRFD